MALFSKVSRSSRLNVSDYAEVNKKVSTSTSTTVRRAFILRRLWIYPICTAIVFVLSEAFIPILQVRILLSAFLSFFPFLSIASLMYEKRTAALRAQTKVLFQALCTYVSGGYSLESAFLLSRPALEKAFGKKCSVAHELERLEKALQARMSLHDALEAFCLHIDFLEILPIFHALSISRIVGSKVIAILRNSCQMMSELIAVNGEVEANNAGRNAEAFVLCVMPFAITYALFGFSEGYMDSAHASPLGIGLMLVAFCIAVISSGFLLTLVSGRRKKPFGTSEKARRTLLPDVWARTIRDVLYRVLPQNTLTLQFSVYSELSPHPEELFLFSIHDSCHKILITAPLFLLLLSLSGFPLFLILPLELAVVLLTQIDLRNRAVERRETLMEEMPLFLSMLVTLLNSGVLLPKAIDTCSKAFPENSCLGNEIRIMKSQMLSGSSAGRSIECFSERTPLPEAQAALLLAARYEITGGSEVLELLSLQASACWSLCRNASRKKKEREALAMVFPMMLDLVSVLLVAITPALLSLQTF